MEGRENDFLLRKDHELYLFVNNPPLSNSQEVHTEVFALEEPVKSACWLDNGEALPFTQEKGTVRVTALPCAYGTSLPVRVMKLTV